ncbi:hypothetical protein IOC57_11880 [Bacillus sp. SD075]|uniref:hypothetical protein n=1 Tax=Bacillus sp. SD075 TaxID=2781732 RepID=UPI001A9778DD|nr:hypothetical protein [Bacillus sp. SD075]MBO0998441.1 hypothetical protein [Bacillus sp. SD075]
MAGIDDIIQLEPFSDDHKNLEVRKKETAQYLKVKKEEAENRRIKDLKAQLDHVTDPDEFLKIAKQIRLGYQISFM